MTPKKLLRFEPCRSPLRALSDDRFHEILREDRDPKTAQRLILCSGKVYYDLDAYRSKESRTDTHIVRVEQLYPMHQEQLQILINDYKHVSQIVWCQEESQNMGAWHYIEPLLRKAFGRDIAYAGRDASASPATGALSIHNLEQADLVHQAFNL
jgi:2-oxoglutarate dehydrogenase E1 component